MPIFSLEEKKKDTRNISKDNIILEFTFTHLEQKGILLHKMDTGNKIVYLNVYKQGKNKMLDWHFHYLLENEKKFSKSQVLWYF